MAGQLFLILFLLWLFVCLSHAADQLCIYRHISD